MSDRFWEARFQRFGHTGWADFAAYAYDQQVRLRVVARLIDTHVTGRDAALDYGCGTGDFARMLGERFAAVTGTDVSPGVVARARALTRGRNVQYQLADKPLPDVDCILSVTVLQHVLDDSALRALLSRFRTALKTGGSVVTLESFADRRTESPYTVLRTRDDFREMFASVGMREVASVELYHPTLDPTAGFRRYRSRFSVRLANRLVAAGVTPARAALVRMATRASRADRDVELATPGVTAATVWQG